MNLDTSFIQGLRKLDCMAQGLREIAEDVKKLGISPKRKVMRPKAFCYKYKISYEQMIYLHSKGKIKFTEPNRLGNVFF